MAFTYKHVVVVGIDGAGNFYRKDENCAPNIRKFMEQGYSCDMCLTAVPTDSGQCWSTMLMGVTSKIHGIHNDKISAATQSLATDEHPTLYRIIRESMPDAVLGCFSNWNPINYGLVDDEQTTKATGEDEGLCERICEYVKTQKPNFLFIQFDSVDGAGHAHGYGSPLHLNQINICDGYAGRIYEAYREAGILEDTLFIVTTDHGGYGRGHGSDTDEEKFVFFVMVGKTVNRVKVPFMQTRSIPAITTYALGIPGNANWQSYLPEGAFTE